MPHPTAYTHKVLVAFLLATAAYVLLAWYDMIYDCNDQLKPTILGWLSMPFKPQQYRDDYNALPIKYKKIVRSVDILILIVLLGLLLVPYLQI